MSKGTTTAAGVASVGGGEGEVLPAAVPVGGDASRRSWRWSIALVVRASR